jgi:EcsC protein family
MTSELIAPEHANFLRQAADYLENPSLFIRLSSAVGQPLEELAKRVVPPRVADITGDALRKAMGLAAGTVWAEGSAERTLEQAHAAAGWTGLWHKVATIGTGFAGGLFGLPGLAVELPVTTGLLFRSIASIAADFGEDVGDPAVRLECLSVFAQGGPTPEDDAAESSYLAARIGMAALIREAAAFLSQSPARGVAEAIARGAAPVLAQLISRIAARFNIAVSQKFIAQGLPVVGGVAGSVLNAAFAEHFNRAARYHFGIRKLERRYGAEAVQQAYRRELAWVRATKRPAISFPPPDR